MFVDSKFVGLMFVDLIAAVPTDVDLIADQLFDQKDLELIAVDSKAADQLAVDLIADQFAVDSFVGDQLAVASAQKDLELIAVGFAVVDTDFAIDLGQQLKMKRIEELIKIFEEKMQITFMRICIMQTERQMNTLNIFKGITYPFEQHF